MMRGAAILTAVTASLKAAAVLADLTPPNCSFVSGQNESGIWIACENSPCCNNTEGPSGQGKTIVLADPNHPSAPGLSDLLGRVNLTADHPQIEFVYDNSLFQGFSADLHDEAIATLQSQGDVLIDHASEAVQSGYTETRSSPWGLQRISQRGRIGPGNYSSSSDWTYTYDGTSQQGQGDVDIYVLDDGIMADHVGFGGRAKMGWSALGPRGLTGTIGQRGHGTLCAGVAASNPWGVARGANIIGVGMGQASAPALLAGVNYIINNHHQRRGDAAFRGSVLSLSAGTANLLFKMVLRDLWKTGIHASVAAGNFGGDFCSGSSARNGIAEIGGPGSKVVIVGALTQADRPANYSNWGGCVDIYAPGTSIVGPGITSIFSSQVRLALALTMHHSMLTKRLLLQIGTGSSFAAPCTCTALCISLEVLTADVAVAVVAGVMAYLIGLNNTLALDPALMKSTLLSMAIDSHPSPWRSWWIHRYLKYKILNNGFKGP